MAHVPTTPRGREDYTNTEGKEMDVGQSYREKLPVDKSAWAL